MCRPASFVVTKDKALWTRCTNSHELIIKEYGFDDTKREPDFVVELEVYRFVDGTMEVS